MSQLATAAFTKIGWHRLPPTQLRATLMPGFDLAILKSANNKGYGQERLPVARDTEIRDLLRECEENGQLAELRQQLDSDHFPALRCFAERNASLAVRSSNPGLIRIGLLALALASLSENSRDTFLILPLYYDAARRLKVDAEWLFRSTARAVSEKAADALGRFLDRSVEDKSLAAMGYLAAADEEGFRYQRQW